MIFMSEDILDKASCKKFHLNPTLTIQSLNIQC